MNNRIANTISKACVVAVAIVQGALSTNAAPPVPTDVLPYAPVWVRPMWAEWDQDIDVAVWVFYRAPENVPSDFDIWQFFDSSDRDGNGMPDPYDYPLLMRGFEIFHEPGPPSKSSLREIDQVPVWFTTREEAVSVLNETGTLTFEQLTQMPSLIKGSATFYHEELHPAGSPANVPKYNYQLRGTLEDGKSFSVHIVGNVHGERVNEVFSVEFE